MKVFIVQTVGRQIDGDYFGTKIEKVFSKASSAEAYAQKLSKTWKDVIQTPDGGMECLCQREIHEAEVEE